MNSRIHFQEWWSYKKTDHRVRILLSVGHVLAQDRRYTRHLSGKFDGGLSRNELSLRIVVLKVDQNWMI